MSKWINYEITCDCTFDLKSHPNGCHTLMLCWWCRNATTAVVTGLAERYRVAIFLCISIPSDIIVPYFLHLQTSEWTLITAVINIMFHKMWGIPWLAENWLASTEGLCSMESVSKPLKSVSVMSWNLVSWSNIATLRTLRTFSCTGMVLHISHIY